MNNGTKCEATRWVDGKPCQNPAKYLAPFNSSLVCGVHRRAFLRCIPLAEMEPDEASASGRADVNGGCELPPRFVVIVWMHDHWGVTYSTDDKADADRVQVSAAKKVPCALVVDTMDAEGVGIGGSHG